MRHPGFLIACLIGGLTNAAIAQSTTAFTYQGRLQNNGQNANGLFDLEFRLFTGATGGAQLGPTSCANNVTVANGLFTASVDFGQQYASPGQRFVEIAVRADNGLDCSNETGFFVLTPRSQLPATPQVAHAQAAFALDTPDGQHPGAVTVDNAGNVGVGTTTPQAPLHLVAPGSEGIRLQGSAAGAANTSWIEFFDSLGSRIGYVGDGSAIDSSMYLACDTGDVCLSTSIGRALVAKPDGKVGIGTPSPAVQLDVRGDIRFGTAGQFRLVAGLENLRLIHGVIAFDGTIVSGSGFTVTHPSQGRYNVVFNAGFGGAPTVTATVMNTPGALTAFAMAQQITSSTVNLEVFQRDGGGFYNQSVQFTAVGPR